MTIEIEAQDIIEFNNTGGMSAPYDSDDVSMDDDGDESFVFMDEDEPEDEVILDEDEDEKDEHPDPKELIFVLPDIPGAEGEPMDEVFMGPIGEDEGEAEETEVESEPADPWDWMKQGGPGKFLHWLHSMMTNVPRHTGRDTTGLEKAISYFEALDKEITKAMRVDFHNEIDSAKAEEARAQIEDGLERLLDRLERVRVTKYKRHAKKNKKKAEEQTGMLVKEAKHTHVGGIVVTVPLLISRLARICINGMVNAGHDIENSFKKLSEKYDLTKREQAELLQLLDDMGYPVRRDRGYDIDDDVDITSSDNYDWAANYPG